MLETSTDIELNTHYNIGHYARFLCAVENLSLRYIPFIDKRLLWIDIELFFFKYKICHKAET